MSATRKTVQAIALGQGAAPRYLGVQEVAQLLGVAPAFVYRRTSAGHPDPIPCYRFGSHLRFLWSEVESWAAQHRKESAQAPVSSLLAVRRNGSSRSTISRRKRG